MGETYKAIEVRKPGEFAEVRRPLQDPGHDQVRIRVEACGVCHSDAATVEGGFPGITYPRDLFIETMPFGGVGPSGMGHYYGKYGFDMLTHAKSMLISPPDVAIKHLFPPFSPEKNADLKIWSEY